MALARRHRRLDPVHPRQRGTVGQPSARLSSRIGHFMPASVLESQLATLERLDPAEDGAVISIDATPSQIVDQIVTTMNLG